MRKLRDQRSGVVEMLEARDPAIKLFGKTIPLPESQAPSEAGESSDPFPMEKDVAEEDKDMCKEITNAGNEDASPEKPEEPDHSERDASSGLNNSHEDDHQTATQDEKTTTDPKTEKDQTEADASGQEKVLKKPDKILPCPRCNSLDTKFCYYNNYNVNQPRHFCKNCQRYWTAGGTMRNVPVGAGRRKNKHSASHYRHIMMPSDGMSSHRVDASDAAHSQVLPSVLPASMRPLNGNGTVLKFGSEAPLCESMASALNLGDQMRHAEMAPTHVENVEEPSCASSVTTSNRVENELPENASHFDQNAMPGFCNGVTPLHPLQCYPGPPWAYPWGPGWNNVAGMAVNQCSPELVNGQENGNPHPVPWAPHAMMAAPAFCAPTVPFPFIPTTFWGCMSSWPNGAWNVPWVGPNGVLSPSSSTSNSGCSGNGSPTLGKHSRDASSRKEEKEEKSLWFPKTLRIDDPGEAAKSSIWATLGIKPDQSEPTITKGGIFKAFQTKTEGKGLPSDATHVLHANPAALSRSQTFQESS